MAAPNFWLSCEFEGKNRPLCGHSVGEQGGFDLSIDVADNSDRVRALTITGRAYFDRRLILRIYQSQALVWRGEFRRDEEGSR
jgi:hypothetical protein